MTVYESDAVSWCCGLRSLSESRSKPSDDLPAIKKRTNTELFIDRTVALYLVDAVRFLVKVWSTIGTIDPQIKYTQC